MHRLPDDRGPVLTLTRLRFRRPTDVVLALIMFRALYPAARGHPGFIRGDVSVSGLRTLIHVSLWRSRREMLGWSADDRHVHAVRWTYGRVSEVWSSEWLLEAVSISASQWAGELGLGVLGERTRVDGDRGSPLP